MFPDDFGGGLASVRQTSDGGYVVARGTWGYIDLTKTNDSGIEEWSYDYTDNSITTKNITDVQQTDDNGFIITGYGYNTSWSGTKLLLIKLSNSGSEEWSYLWEPTGTAEYGASGESIVQTVDGGYAVTGSVYTGNASNEMSLFKFNSDGSLDWYEQFYGSGVDNGLDLEQTNDNGFIITGYKWISSNNIDLWVIKTGDYAFFGPSVKFTWLCLKT